MLKPLTFNASQATGAEELAGAPPLCVNLLADETGTLRTRPGIATWTDFPSIIPNASPVIGMVPWNDYLVYATADRTLWALTSTGSVTALSDATAGSQLDGVTAPIFAVGKSAVYVIGGGVPQTWPGAGLSARLAGAPPSGTHIAALAQRLVINDVGPSGEIFWSDVGEATGYTSWDTITAGFREAEARPDRVVAQAENSNELFVFGQSTLQVFLPDPVEVFTSTRALNVGTASPYSIVRADEAFVWLDNNQRFVVSNGRSYEEISQGLYRTVRSFADVTDAIGFRLQRDQWDVIGWIFPAEGRTLTWQKSRAAWSEWRGYGADGYTPLSVTSHCQWPERGLHLVGLSSGQIAILDSNAGNDLGASIRSEAVSGFEDRGTTSLKHCRAARFKFRRGMTGVSTPPTASISWRDDTGAFGPPHALVLGNGDQVNPVLEIRAAGTYRQRQWRLEFVDSQPLTFVGAEEDFIVLSR